MEVVLIKALQLLCCLSLLVVLHEGGHFGFSKLFGVKVEKFYMFFDYKFHLFSTRSKWFTRLFPHFKDNETEYQKNYRKRQQNADNSVCILFHKTFSHLYAATACGLP